MQRIKNNKLECVLMSSEPTIILYDTCHFHAVGEMPLSEFKKHSPDDLRGTFFYEAAGHENSPVAAEVSAAPVAAVAAQPAIK